jgi:UDP-glucuronate decarboxylase
VPGRPIVITGASGWLGRALLEQLLTDVSAEPDAPIRLFGSSARSFVSSCGQSWPIRPLSSLTGADVEDAWVFHLAYLTPDKIERVGVQAFAEICLGIDKTVMDALAQAKPCAVFVSSSGSAAAVEDGRSSHPYAVAKLEQERRFAAWAQSSGIPVASGRIFNLSGPYIPSPGPYALESFTRQGLQTRLIRIEARAPTVRSYLHVSDVCRLARFVVEAGDCAVFDLAGPLAVELKDVAEAVAQTLNLERDSIQRSPMNAWASNSYLGDAAQTLGLALRFGVTLQPFISQVEATVSYLRNQLQP